MIRKKPFALNTSAFKRPNEDSASPATTGSRRLSTTEPKNYVRLQSLSDIDLTFTSARHEVVISLLPWFAVRVAAAFRVPLASVTSWLEQDDPLRALGDFLTDAGRRRILVQWNPTATQLVVTSSLQSLGAREGNTKALYFLKLRK